MKRLLEKFKQEKKVVSIYNDSADTGNCWTGFVQEVDDDHVLLAHITANGFYDGFGLFAIDGIFNIEQGTYYEKKVQRLYELRKQSHPSFDLDMERDLLEAFLCYAKSKDLVVSIALTESDDYPSEGLIEEITEEFISLKLIKSNGFEDGFAYVKMEDICFMFVDSLEEQSLKLLYNDLNK